MINGVFLLQTYGHLGNDFILLKFLLANASFSGAKFFPCNFVRSSLTIESNL